MWSILSYRIIYMCMEYVRLVFALCRLVSTRSHLLAVLYPLKEKRLAQNQNWRRNKNRKYVKHLTCSMQMALEQLTQKNWRQATVLQYKWYIVIDAVFSSTYYGTKNHMSGQRCHYIFAHNFAKSKFFRCLIQTWQQISSKSVIKYRTTPQMHCYTTTWSISVRKPVTPWNIIVISGKSQGSFVLCLTCDGTFDYYLITNSLLSFFERIFKIGSIY